MIRSHAVTSPDPIQEGGSAVALCGKSIHRTHWLAFSELFQGDPESQLAVRIKWSDITCKDCRYSVWLGNGWVYAAIEAEEYEQLKAKGRIA